MPLPGGRRERQGASEESGITDLSSLLTASKKKDIGWTMAREQATQAAEPKLRTPEMITASRKRSSLVGLLRDLVIYDPGNPDHGPVRPVHGWE